MGRKKSLSDAQLLETARQVFVEHGFGASTKEIARRAGVSEGVIYQRFLTKDELFFAAMIPPPVDVKKLLRPGRSKGLKLIEKVTLSMVEYSRATLPVLLPLMMHPGFRFEEFAGRHPDSPMFVLRRQLVQFFIEEQRTGRIGGVDPGAAALLVWSTANSIAFFERLGAHGGQFDPEMIRKTVRCLWDGIGPKAH
jgi:AcrR family transcriptional regulator